MKPKTRLLPFLLLSAGFASVVNAQASDDSSSNTFQGEDPLAAFDRYLDANGIRVRRRVGGEHELRQAAQIHAVQASGSANSQVSVDGSISWAADFLQFADEMEFSAFFEAHKNTAFPAKQESYIYGLMGTKQVFAGEDLQMVLDTTLAWKTDKYTERGLFLKGMLAFEMPEWGAGELRESENFAWRWLPQVGLVYENASSVIARRTVGRGSHGDVLRLVATVGADVYPLAASLDQRLRVHTEFSYWGQIFESGGFKPTDDSEHQFRAVIDYAIDAGRTIFAGVEYGTGANPEIGLQREDYVMFHLSVMAGGLR